ncbi:MAG: CRISPR-associated endonuclease Cas2 [Kiritimatiellae bacterium]|nr:CRISPR-associated endonuclease Cas2 [Kiritimatiellia bacterium]MBQ6142621.1 CRISPR-associated endonuclease Cas2 [Kiritimatiellia bacterium]
MLMLVSYDVNTVNAAGRRRLRRIAKLCENWGIRVQNSVFECTVDWGQWLALKAQLETICEPTVDSLRYYNLGNNYKEKVVHYGAKPTVDPSADALVI